MISQEVSRQLYSHLKDVRGQVIEDLMEKATLVKEDIHVSKIIGIMLKDNSHEVFVQHPDKTIICLNMRDTLVARDINTMKASTIGKRIPSLTSKESIGNAARIMSLHRLRALPIVDGKNHEVIGQLSSKRILQYIFETFVKKKINFDKRIIASDLMTPELVTIGPEDKVATARNIMVKDMIDHLPIVEQTKDGKNMVIGILTSSDILKTLMPSDRIARDALISDHEQHRLELAARGLADKNLITISPNETINSVIDLMLKSNSTYALVKSMDSVLGIITFRDVIALLGEQVESEIPAYIIGLPEDPFEAELVKSKFTNTIKLLYKIFPEIVEARCKIKIKDVTGERKRYEISANIISPYRRYTYTSKNEYDIARIFDEMSDSFKNQISRKKSSDKQRESVRFSPKE
ncbi:CBS domain-containing protein [Candidatus Nitrosocosmicus franklandus]|uniref:Inosine 5'-monophosphate dehydrogenase n=1 Tax=Candidatus Nitrosocosmicus franklandianus TaxID=1798806 RepID=A0A484IAT1_9ARCH|nr:CBS domain-containing protein [Candidatus Nitrosocosmicus franklandus]VFJ13125.1 Inosine 5'-monophosphate dehydrogenase [Candidatus Nitrosocosmicus franklandus]